MTDDNHNGSKPRARLPKRPRGRNRKTVAHAVLREKLKLPGANGVTQREVIFLLLEKLRSMVMERDNERVAILWDETSQAITPIESEDQSACMLAPQPMSAQEWESAAHALRSKRPQ